MVDERDARIKELDDSLQSVCKSYDSLKMAKMVEITDGDMESAQKRLSKLIRDVNRGMEIFNATLDPQAETVTVKSLDFETQSQTEEVMTLEDLARMLNPAVVEYESTDY